MNANPKKILILPLLSLNPESGQEIIQPRLVNLETTTVNILDKCDPILNLSVLKEKLIKLGIRFNTEPKVYQKKDYWLLICILYRALTHLYEFDINDYIVKEWIDPHSDNYIPSEKLVADTIAELNETISEEKRERIRTIANEAGERLLNDQELSNLLSQEVTRLEGLVSQEANTRSSEITRVEGLISDETSARQSADSNLQDNIDAEAGTRATEITRVEGLISAEELARQLADTNLLNTKQDTLTAGTNISITNNVISAVDTIYDDTEVRGLISSVSSEVDDIQDLIPNQATSSNLLADKNFVNSSIATNTATFRGTYNSIPELTGDINDYIFVTETDSAGNTLYKRYKNDGTQWVFEYTLNNSSFTANQWAAINSGATSTLVTNTSNHLSNTDIHVTTADKNRWNAAEANVLSNWTESDSSSDTYILNKPTKLSDFTDDLGSSPTHTHSLYLTQHLDISGKEDKSNKVTSISNSSTNTQYPSAKCVYDEFTTTVTSEQVQSVGDINVYLESKIPVIDKTSDSSISFALDPNKMYMFGTRTNLTITLNPGDSRIVNEYMFQFTSGSVATTLLVPNTVVWLKDPDVLTGKKYAVSIENNLGIIGEWDND